MNEPLSFKVAATLAAYRWVAHNGTENTVGYPTGPTVLPIGITQDTVKDTNQAIPVKGVGRISKLTFNDTVASGGLVASDVSGFGIPFVTGLTATTTSFTLTAYGGILLDAKVNLTGTVANVLIQPGLG
jgi:hypothetical protein